MNYRKFTQKFFMVWLWILSAPLIVTLIIPIIIQKSLNKKEKELLNYLKNIDFNNYREIETSNFNRFLLFNEDGRFVEIFKNYRRLYDIRDYNLEFIISDNSNQMINILAGYMIAGKVGAMIGTTTKPCYLILKKRKLDNFEDIIKYEIREKESIEMLYNLLIYYKDKNLIE